MKKEEIKKISKFLSYVLRHNPDKIGIKIKKNGWTNVKELIKKSPYNLLIDFNKIKYVVDNCDKKRFSFSEDFCEIRANQGYSIDIEIEYKEVIPPKTLYHGAPVKVIDNIMKNGLKKMKRHACHLSKDIDTASKVGSRRGEFKVLKIEALKMVKDGYKIYISENGVYLVDKVPSEYIKIV